MSENNVQGAAGGQQNENIVSSLLRQSLMPNDLGRAVAEDVIAELEAGGFDPQEMAALEAHVQEHTSAWTPEAVHRLQQFFDATRYASNAGQRIFWGRGPTANGFMPIHSVSLMEILDGAVWPDRFSSVLREIADHRFGNDLELMSLATGIAETELFEYLNSRKLPENYETVILLARSLDVDVEALAYAWVADRMSASVFSPIVDATKASNGMMARFANLVHAAMAAQDSQDVSIELEDIYLGRIDIAKIAAYIDIALNAGFDTQVIYSVALDYLHSLDRRGEQGIDNFVIDNYLEDYEELIETEMPRVAAIASRMASLYWQGTGESGLASVAEYNGAVAMLQQAWNGRDTEDDHEFFNPASWEVASLEQARDFYERSADLLARFGDERQITMGGAMAENLPSSRNFVDALLRGDVEELRRLRTGGDEIPSAAAMRDRPLTEQELSVAWRAIPPSEVIWRIGIRPTPVVAVKGKGYYMSPAERSADVYFDAVRGNYERIPVSIRRSNGGGNNGGSTPPPIVPTGGTPPPSAGGVQASASRFAGFVDGMQAYLDGLSGDPRMVVEEFAASYSSIWKLVMKDQRFDLITRALDVSEVAKGYGVSSTAFTATLHALCQREGYILQDVPTTGIENTDYIVRKGYVPFGSGPAAVSSAAAKPPAAVRLAK